MVCTGLFSSCFIACRTDVRLWQAGCHDPPVHGSFGVGRLVRGNSGDELIALVGELAGLVGLAPVLKMDGERFEMGKGFFVVAAFLAAAEFETSAQELLR